MTSSDSTPPNPGTPRPGFSSRRVWTDLTDAQLLAQCDVDTYRASGPGGQKRNKTSSAVRLRHGPSGLIVIAEESRSQHDNKAKALQRLRRALYWQLREPPGDPASIFAAEGRLPLTAKHPQFWPAAGLVLDMLAHHAAQVSTVAENLQVSTAHVVDFLQVDPRVWQEANRLRVEWGQKPLKPS